MGWDYTKGATKADIIAELTADSSGEASTWENGKGIVKLGYRYERRCLAKSVRGNTLWTVEEVTRHKNPVEVTRHIGCYLLASERGFGYGYKAMSEDVHPYYYDCPLKFFDMVPVANQEWREKCRAWRRGHG